jgi:hypothetical protein
MMSDTDKKELEDYFSKQYLLIPKNRLYHIAGGMLGVLVLGLGISYQAVLKVLESEMADKARQNIMAIEKNVTAAQQRIEGLERDATSAADWLRSTAVQESNVAKQRIAEVEQAGKEAANKLAATTIESLQAKEVKLVDKNGKTKLLLATTTTGSGLLQLYDDTDKERLRLTKNSSGYAGLWFKDSEGSHRMILTTDATGRSSLYLYDSTKKKRLQLYEDKGLSALEIYDDNGAIIPPSPRLQPPYTTSPISSAP